MSFKKILIVGNHLNSSDQVFEKIKQKGHMIFIAESGNSAIDFLDKEFFDIIISELNMNNGDGLKLLEFSNAQIKKPKFYFWSAPPETISIVDCIRAGALDFFIKPIEIDEIFNIIKLK